MYQPHFDGFTPTSTNYRWRGKYKCNYCKSTGYVIGGWRDWQGWWGHKHGENCKKKGR